MDNRNFIKYQIWISKGQDFQTKKCRLTTKYLKKTFQVHPRQLIIHLQKDLHKFLHHQKNFVRQYKAINDLRSNLQDEVLIHVYFSETIIALSTQKNTYSRTRSCVLLLYRKRVLMSILVPEEYLVSFQWI